MGDISSMETSERKFGIFTDSRVPIIEAPTPEQIARLKENPKIEYFPTRVPEDWIKNMPLTDADMESIRMPGMPTDFVYNELVLNRLEKYVANIYKDRFPIGIRGTVASIEGPIINGQIRINDIQQMLAEGSDRGGDETNIAIMDKTKFEDPWMDPQIHYRTKQWIAQSSQEMRKALEADPEARKKIFPVLFVYDLSKLKPGTHYGGKLPDSQEERAEAIIKAYVTDYPHPKR